MFSNYTVSLPHCFKIGLHFPFKKPLFSIACRVTFNDTRMSRIHEPHTIIRIVGNIQWANRLSEYEIGINGNGVKRQQHECIFVYHFECLKGVDVLKN